MAAVTVAFDGTRVIAADTNTGWSKISTSPTTETDFFYQNTASVSCKISSTTTDQGFYYTSGSTDMSATPRVWLAKVLLTTKDKLVSPNYLRLRIGSATTAYHVYTIFTNTSYPIAGGWQIVPIDPNVSGYRGTPVGSPDLTAVIYWAITAYLSATSKSENLAMDAIDWVDSGTGLTLTGGDGGDADGTFTSFVTEDEGTAANRWGIVTTREGILYIVGTLTIGSGTATVFTDSNQTVVFPNGRFNTSFAGIKFSLANASNVITISTITYIGRGQYGYDGGTADTRPDYTISSTSGTYTEDSCVFTNFRAITYTSACTITSSRYNACLLLTQAGATFSYCTFNASPAATNVAFMTASNISLISYCTFVSGGTGHAIEISSAAGSPFTLTGNVFTSYATDAGTAGNRALYNNSGSNITINVFNGDAPSVRNAGVLTTTINVLVNYTITVQDASANAIVGAQVAMFKTADDSVLLASTGTGAAGTVTGTVARSTGAVYIRVRQSTSIATFSTAQSFASEELNTDTNHSFVSGEAVVYNNNGGTASIGLTDGTTYYVNAVDANTVTMHLTAAAAIAGTGDIDLTTDGTETHQLDPVRYYPNSTVGTIGTTDFSVTITMIEDTTVTG